MHLQTAFDITNLTACSFVERRLAMLLSKQWVLGPLAFGFLYELQSTFHSTMICLHYLFISDLNTNLCE